MRKCVNFSYWKGVSLDCFVCCSWPWFCIVSVLPFVRSVSVGLSRGAWAKPTQYLTLIRRPCFSMVYSVWETSSFPYTSSLYLVCPFLIPSVLPNCLKGGSGREFDQGLSVHALPPKTPSRNRRLKIDKIVHAFNVKHFPQKSSPRKKHSLKVSLSYAKNCIPIASKSIPF